MSECNCVIVMPVHIKVIVGLGCAEDGVATAEKLEEVLEIPLDEVLEALDGLVRVSIAADIDAEEFYLIDRGVELFDAIYAATGAVLND